MFSLVWLKREKEKACSPHTRTEGCDAPRRMHKATRPPGREHWQRASLEMSQFLFAFTAPLKCRVYDKDATGVDKAYPAVRKTAVRRRKRKFGKRFKTALIDEPAKGNFYRQLGRFFFYENNAARGLVTPQPAAQKRKRRTKLAIAKFV